MKEIFSNDRFGLKGEFCESADDCVAEANAHCNGAAATTSAIALFDHCGRNDNFVFILL